MTDAGDQNRFEESDEILSRLSDIEANDHAGLRPSRLHRLTTNRDFAILVVAIVLFVFFAVMGRRFLTEFTMIDISRRASILGILAVGMTFLFVAGELDLSIGSHYGFLLIIMSYQNEKLAIDPAIAAGRNTLK